MSRTQLAFNSGDLAFQEIITSRPNVNSATRVVSRNAVLARDFSEYATNQELATASEGYSRRRSICQTDRGRSYSEKSNWHLGSRTDHGGGTSFAPFGLGEVARWPKFLKGAKLSKRSGGEELLKCDVHPFRFFFRGTCLQPVLPA
jgi:hypothetical protein